MGGDEDVRFWANAPQDVLGLVLSRLCVGDAAVFYAVCKTWSQVPPVLKVERIPSDEELCSCPCLIFPNKRFFHPLTNTWFQMPTTHALPEALLLAQKHEWLLMRLRNDRPFFFNPFTNKKIELPDYPICTLRSATFSSPPTTPNCQIVQFELKEDEKIVVETIKRGQPAFHFEEVCTSESFAYNSLEEYKCIFFNKEYYCMGKEGEFIIYNPDQKSHRLIGSLSNIWTHFGAFDCGRFLFEGFNDLWTVFIARHGREICICKLQLETMVWERVHDLEDKMIFLSYQSCLMMSSNVRGTSNKIYFPKFVGGHCVFYSLATNMYHTFERGSSYKSLDGFKDLMQCTWIQVGSKSRSFPNSGEELFW